MEGLVISDAVKDLIINIINIIVLFVIVRALAYKPIKKFLDARKARIAAELKDAENAKADALAKTEQYEALIKESKAKGSEIISEAERTAKQNAEEIIAAAKIKAEEITQKARETAENERNAKIVSMQGEITSLAFDIAGQVLSREVSDSDNMAVADSFFEKYKA